MSVQTAWLEGFTGIVLEVTDPPDVQRQEAATAKATAIADAAQAYALKKERQAAMLANVRSKLDVIKGEVQAALSRKITQGPFKGKSFLDVERDQTKEIDVDEVRTTKPGKGPVLPPDVANTLVQNGVKIGDLGLELREARFVHGTVDEALFEEPEIQAEFWTPVKLERIFPEGFITNKFSETQQMVDATNELYMQMIEEKKLRGELTPDRDFLRDAIELGGDLAEIASSGLGAFSGEELKLAKEILEGVGAAMGAIGQIYDQVKDSDYSNAASSAIGLAGTLTTGVMGALGLDKNVVQAAGSAFKAGSTAVLMGQSLAKFAQGSGTLSDALGLMGEMVAQSLSSASSASTGDTAEGLALAAKAAPALFKSLGLASSLPDKVKAGDYKGIVNGLADITKSVLSSVPGLGEVGNLDSLVDLSAAGVNMGLQMAINVKRGHYLAAFNGVIDDIGENLGSLLSQVGVDKGVADQVVGIYKGSASATKALQLMATNPPKVAAAISELTGGLKSALGGTGDPVLVQVGDTLDLAVKQLVKVGEVKALYDAGKEDPAKYDEALQLVESQLSSGLDDWDTLFSASAGDEEEEEEEEEEDTGDSEGGQGSAKGDKPKEVKQSPAQKLAALVEQVKQGGAPDPSKLNEAMDTMKAEQKKERDAADREEADLLLAQAQLDLKSLSDAERAGAEASNIEGLISDLLRDRMLLKLATQIAQGGAAFLAKFVPVLGAVSAGVKLAANLVAVAQRAQQLDAWIKSQGDLQAAQSPLSSAASNFVKAQGQQLAHYSAQAFFAATELAGEITKVAGPAAGIGAAITTAATAGAAAEELLLKHKNRADIERAWKVTVKAMRNPGNRKLALKARELNPSLAKFSIAWGAVVLKDPLARNAMSACGLSEASLNDEQSDVPKVVKYLEVFYEDDQTLYRDPSEPTPEWLPEDIEVTLASWSQFKRKALTPGGVTIGKSGALEGLLGEYLAIEDLIEQTSQDLDDAQNAFTLAREALKAASTSSGSGNTKGKTPIPAIDDLKAAITAHGQALQTRNAALNRIGAAYAACTATPVKPPKEGKDDPNVKAALTAMKGLQTRAERSATAAKADETGLLASLAMLEKSISEMKQEAAKTSPQTATTGG